MQYYCNAKIHTTIETVTKLDLKIYHKKLSAELHSRNLADNVLIGKIGNLF